MNRYSYVYVLASQRNGTLYIGVTSDLIKRVWQQQLNRSSQATMEKTPEGVCIPSRRVAPSSLIGLKAEVLNPSQFFDKKTAVNAVFLRIRRLSKLNE